MEYKLPCVEFKNENPTTTWMYGVKLRLIMGSNDFISMWPWKRDILFFIQREPFMNSPITPTSSCFALHLFSTSRFSRIRLLIGKECPPQTSVHTSTWQTHALFPVCFFRNSWIISRSGISQRHLELFMPSKGLP